MKGVSTDMKKIISFIITLSLLCALVPSGAAAYSDVEDSKAIEVITGLGIMEGYSDGTFLPDNNITRAEFANVIASVYNYGTETDGTAEWKATYFTDIYSNTELIPKEEMEREEDGIFSDVPSTSWAYESIKLVSELGLMVGDGSGSFGADDNLTLEQALKVLVTMMGYGDRAQMRGGYPNGYVSIAGELGLAASISTSASDYAMRRDVAQMIYNAFDVELMQYVFEGATLTQTTIDDETFLSKFLGIYWDRGRMTDNGYTSLTAVKSNPVDRVVIDGEAYYLDENEFRDYLGYEVEYYYSFDDSDRHLEFARLTGRDTVYKIDMNDFVSYKDSTITYNYGTREKTVTTVKAPYFINNNGAQTEFNEDTFKCNYGTLTVVKPYNGSDADLLILKSYRNFNIEYVDTYEEILYSSSSVMGNELDVNSDDKIIRIYNPLGEEISLDGITPGSVASVSEGSGITEIYISDEVVSDFKVAVIGTNENDETTLKNENGEVVILSKDYTDINSDNLPKVGSTYEFYLDILGRAVKFNKQSSEYETAFMSDVRILGDPGFEDSIRIKYFDMNARQLVTAYCAEKVRLTDTEDNVSTYSLSSKLETLYNKLNEYTYNNIDDTPEKTGGMFRYKMNDEGEFTEIELAGSYENSNDDSSRLVEIKLVNSDKSLNFYNGKGLIGGTVIIDDNTQILQCNFRDDSFSENKGYNIVTRSFYSENKKFEKDETRFYSTTKNSPVAEYMIETTDPSQSISAEDHTVGIVTKMYEGVNDDGDVVSFITLDSTEYEVDEEAMLEGNITNMPGDSTYETADGNVHYFEVEEGDIIRYALGSGGEIRGIQLLYDADSDYSGGIVIDGTEYNGWSERGNLAGCADGYYKAVYSHSNPFSVTNGTDGNSFSSDSYAWSYYNGNMRVMLGSVLRVGSGYMVTTTRNMAENPGEVSYEGDGVYATNIYSTASATLVTISRNKVNISSIPVTSLRSYDLAGDGCDRVLITSRLGVVKNIIVYRYE